MSAEQVAPIREAIAEARASGTIAVGDISNSLAAVGPMREAGLDGVVFHELLGFKERDGALIDVDARHAIARRGRRGARVAGAACAVLDVARIVQGDQGRRRRERMPDHERASRRVGGGSGIPREGQRPVARHARDDRRLARRLAGPACDPVGYLDRHGVIDREDAGGPWRAVRRSRVVPAGGDRRDARHLPAQQPVGRRRLSADRTVLSSRASVSPSAPTAWPASRT